MTLNFVVVILVLFFLICRNLVITKNYCNQTLAKQVEQAGKDFDKVCLNEAAKIIEARAKNKSVANVPATDLTDKNVTFMLLPTLKPNDVQNLTTWNQTALRHSCYNSSRLTMLWMSGIQGDANSDAELIRPLLGSTDMNLIIVNWNTFSLHFDVYYLLNNTVPALGRVCAKFVKLLIKNGTSRKKIRLAGASAGAQAAGLCGKEIEPKVAAITAFDPAGPCFASQPDSFRLAITDADYVSMFHCSSVLGVPARSYNGKADYFLGCAGIYLNDCVNETSPYNIGSCSHVTCAKYLFPTVTNPNNLIGVHCDSQEHFFNRTCSYYKREIAGFHSRLDIFGKIYVSIPYPLEPSYNNNPPSWLPEEHRRP